MPNCHGGGTSSAGKVREWFTQIVTAIREKLADAVSLVKSFPRRAVSALGNIATALYNKGKADPMAYIVGLEIYDHLEKVVDRLEDVANRVSGIVIEHV